MNPSHDPAQHSAGATVRHRPPFEQYASHYNAGELPRAVIDQWVIPYYMAIASWQDDDWVASIQRVKADINRELCLLLLGDRNWRSRLVGAYFAAVKGYDDLVDVIGVHFIKSEVCCVGHVYALVLAFFNSPQSRPYFDLYLDYYLTRPDLGFDQEYALEAVLYLDRANGTHALDRYAGPWQQFQQQRREQAAQSRQLVARFIEAQEGPARAAEYLAGTDETTPPADPELSTDFFDHQLPILRALHGYPA